MKTDQYMVTCSCRRGVIHLGIMKGRDEISVHTASWAPTN